MTNAAKHHGMLFSIWRPQGIVKTRESSKIKVYFCQFRNKSRVYQMLESHGKEAQE